MPYWYVKETLKEHIKKLKKEGFSPITEIKFWSRKLEEQTMPMWTQRGYKSRASGINKKIMRREKS